MCPTFDVGKLLQVFVIVFSNIFTEYELLQRRNGQITKYKVEYLSNCIMLTALLWCAHVMHYNRPFAHSRFNSKIIRSYTFSIRVISLVENQRII